MSELKPCAPTNDELNEAFELGYQACLHDNEKLTWDAAEELQQYRRAQPVNEPLTLCFGRGELGVGTAYEAPSGPSREINIRKLSVPLPVASPTGDKGKYVDELENVLVRMQFESAESARVLERAVRTVLAGFGSPTNEPLTLDELREMEGEPVWVHRLEDNQGWWVVIKSTERDKVTTDYGGYFEFADYGKTWLAYRHKPEEGTL